MNYLFDFLDEIRTRLNDLPEGRLLLCDYFPSNKSLMISDVQEQDQESLQFIHDYFIQHFSNK